LPTASPNRAKDKASTTRFAPKLSAKRAIVSATLNTDNDQSCLRKFWGCGLAPSPQTYRYSIKNLSADFLNIDTCPRAGFPYWFKNQVVSSLPTNERIKTRLPSLYPLYCGDGPSVTCTKSSGRSHLAKASFTCSAVSFRYRLAARIGSSRGNPCVAR
jgi:hypothetical protein